MRALICLLLVTFTLTALTEAKTVLRFKRQIEREDLPASEIVVVRDKNGELPPPNTRYDILPKEEKDKNCTDEDVEFDFDEDDGRFNFGGRIPDFHDFHGSFHEMFDVLNRRFEGEFVTASS